MRKKKKGKEKNGKVGAKGKEKKNLLKTIEKFAQSVSLKSFGARIQKTKEDMESAKVYTVRKKRER